MAAGKIIVAAMSADVSPSMLIAWKYWPRAIS
jgi:hypothetical protein